MVCAKLLIQIAACPLHALVVLADTRHKRCAPACTGGTCGHTAQEVCPCMHWWYVWTHSTRGVPLHALVVHADTRHKRCAPACTGGTCGHTAQEVYPCMHWWYMRTHGTRGVPLHALVVHVDTRHKRCAPACTGGTCGHTAQEVCPCMHWWYVWAHGTRGVPLHVLYSPTAIMATHSGTNSSLQTLRPLPAAVRGREGRDWTGSACCVPLPRSPT